MSKTSTNIKKFTILDLFRYKSLRILTIILCLVDCVFYLQYLAPTLMLDQFDFDIFVNGVAVQSSQVLAGLFGLLTITKIPRRVSGCVSFGFIAVCAGVLIFVWDQDSTDVDDESNKIVVLIFIFLIQMTVTNAFNNYAVYLN